MKNAQTNKRETAQVFYLLPIQKKCITRTREFNPFKFTKSVILRVNNNIDTLYMIIHLRLESKTKSWLLPNMDERKIYLNSLKKARPFNFLKTASKVINCNTFSPTIKLLLILKDLFESK